MHHTIPATAPGETGGIYRDGAHGAREELKQRLATRASERQAIEPARAVYAARVGRAAAGAVLVLGAVAMFGRVAMGWILSLSPEPSYVDSPPGQTTALLLVSWPAAAVAYALAGAVARRRFDAVIGGSLELSGDLYAQLEQLRRVSVADALRAVLGGVEHPSVALPLLGACLLVPLSLHAAVAVVVAAASGAVFDPAGFDLWVGISALLVGHVHVLLAAFALRFAGRLTSGWPPHRGESAGWSAWRWCTVASLVPGAVLLGIPVMIVAVTGLFAPLLFRWASDTVTAERDALAALMNAA